MSTVLNAPVIADVPVRPYEPGPTGTHITIRGLTKYFAGWPLYENFDLDIPKHAIVSVFGPNGCGKSSRSRRSTSRCRCSSARSCTRSSCRPARPRRGGVSGRSAAVVDETADQGSRNLARWRGAPAHYRHAVGTRLRGGEETQPGNLPTRGAAPSRHGRLAAR